MVAYFETKFLFLWGKSQLLYNLEETPKYHSLLLETY